MQIDWERLPASRLSSESMLAGAWDTLNAARRDLPFMTANAIAHALLSFGDGSETLLVGRRGERVVVMLILISLGKLRWQTFQPSQLPLGAYVSEADVLPGAVADSLLRGPLRRCLTLSLTQMDPWLGPRELDSPTTLRSDYVSIGWIEVTGTFEDYWSARGKNLRQNMRKQRSKLSTEGITVQARTWTESADMGAAVERYVALESAGWKAAQGTAIRLDNDQGRFYRELLEAAAHTGGAVVYECLFNDRTVAMNLCLRRTGTLTILKTTYDESIQNYSPAFLLSQDVLASIFAEGSIRRLEYYGRLMDWHTKWTEKHRMLYHLTAYRWPLIRQLAARRSQARQAAAHSADHAIS